MSFEAHYRVRLPADVRDYFRAVDGMAEGCEDKALFGFLPLAAIKSVPEELARMDGIPDYSGIIQTLDAAARCFVFAEFLVWSHVYALRLSADPSAETPVIRISGGRYAVMSHSFTDFAEAYLANADAVLFPG